MIRRDDNNTQDEAGQNKKHTCNSNTQSGQERVVYDWCVFKKLAGFVLVAGTVV